MTDEQHNKYIAWSFIAHGAFQTVIAILFVAIFGFMASITRSGDELGSVFFLLFGAIMVLFQAIFAVPAFVAAYAMFKKRSWAKTAAIIGAVMSAMNVPIGTLACVYAMWFFVGDNWKNVYEQPLAAAPDAPADNLPEARWEPYVRNEEGEVVYRTVDPPDWR